MREIENHDTLHFQTVDGWLTAFQYLIRIRIFISISFRTYQIGWQIYDFLESLDNRVAYKAFTHDSFANMDGFYGCLLGVLFICFPDVLPRKSNVD